MNSHIWKCSQCNKNTKMYIKNDIININCQCGYYSPMRIKEFIKNCKIDQSHTTINDGNFKDITTDIQKGIEHLLSYFKEIKIDHMSRLNVLMNELESSYEESYKRNKDLLTCLQILIDNYDGTNTMKKNILDNDINIYQCKDSDNIDKVIQYYKEYNIIEKKINIEEEKTITEHTGCVNSLLRLKNGKVASCSDDKTIRIYDPSNDYHCDRVNERYSFCGINSICQLDDDTIVSCSSDKSIMIGDYTIKDAHEGCISKVISLPNNRIASCGDNTIKIWKSNPPYSSTPLKALVGHLHYVDSLLYIKERDIMISGSADGTLRLWNMSTYQCDKVIEGVGCCWTNSIYQIDKDRVIVGGFASFHIVNIDRYVIEKTIKDKTLGSVNCFLKLRNYQIILCGCENGIFCFYDMKTEDYKTTKNNHNDTIFELLLINDNLFMSCSYDKTIKVWKY